MLGHPEMFGCFTLDDRWLPANELHPVDEHLENKPTEGAKFTLGSFVLNRDRPSKHASSGAQRFAARDDRKYL